ncbi:thiamine-phosphate kinase [Hyperthermus butylicus]|uniref:Thiamine-monophosphate kinase n=1 Tax=Hyperthermus butylicus (strain DSM 5456 / JCM 9403 / PLM1-5) TaxID=415426 RepID=A2BKY5_HYPBU|nr:thiamine-phosphate kinase [Hyperthermus butylicus]ABM80646.1 putative thiamine-monophosphate kinase [Hyperthermus butylicus DSM 5456]
MKLSELGEHEAVKRLIEEILAGQWRCPSLGPGDDAACVGGGFQNLILKIDGGSLASLWAPWMEPADIGWQAVAAAASDLVAKGAKPLAFAVSLGLDPGEDIETLKGIVRGAAEAAQAHGAWLLGGDTNSCSNCGWIDVAAVGLAEKPVGLQASPGDTVYVTTGRIGLAGLVLDSLAKGRWREAMEAYPRAFSEFARPRARLEFVELAGTGCITAATDSSDGLAYSLGKIAEAAHALVELENIPVEPEALRYAEEYGVDPLELALYGGQEYEVIFAVRGGCEKLVEERAATLGLAVARIGRLREGPQGITYRGRTLSVRGWDNFKNM